VDFKTSMTEYHRPALLQESLEGLAIIPNGIYVDLTYGGGGHGNAILKKLTGGKLIAFDQDHQAKGNILEDEQLVFISHNFRYLSKFLRLKGIKKVDGILGDFGVSSHQLDTPDRGFSFRFGDAPLDMRMNKSGGQSAETIANTYSSEDLSNMLFQYGELRRSRKIADLIVKRRKLVPLRTTGDLITALQPLISPNNVKELARVFQAFRIEVNEELEVIKEVLMQAAKLLKPQGRLVLISYHSLEDRLVKNFIRTGTFDGKPEKDLFGNFDKPFNAINKKVIVPSIEEVKANPRARSARLRIASKI